MLQPSRLATPPLGTKRPAPCVCHKEPLAVSIHRGAGCKFKECSKCKRPLPTAQTQGARIQGRWNVTRVGSIRRECISSNSPVRVDVAVRQSCCPVDQDTITTLRIPRERIHGLQRGHGTLHRGSICGESSRAGGTCRSARHTAHGQRGPGKVSERVTFQRGSSRAVQGRWKKPPRRFKAHVFKNARAHISCSSRDIQPNQPSRPTRHDMNDPAPTIGIEHHSSGHLRLDGHGAVDADRRTSITPVSMPAHVSGKAVRARRNPDLVHGAVADGRGELRHGAHQDFVQMPAVQHEGRRITGRGHPHGHPHDGS